MKDVATCWWKWASLWEMMSVWLPIPNWFVLTTNAYWKDSKERENEVLEAFDKLDTKFVAVRSSWTKEDWVDDSFAWQFDTYLFVTRENIIKKIKECHDSVNSERIVSYCEYKWIDIKSIKVAVVIQKMVNSESAWVCFTVNPVSQNPEEIMIEAWYWVWEAVVSWMITPDNYIVNKKTWEIKKDISQQEKKLVLSDKWWTKEVKIPKKEQENQKLSDKHIQELAELAKKIEEHYWKPMDTEWAIENWKLFILQARPITTLGNTTYAEDYDFFVKWTNDVDKKLIIKYIDEIKNNSNYIEFQWWISNMCFWDLCYGLYRERFDKKYWYTTATDNPYILIMKWLIWTSFNITIDIARKVYYTNKSIYESKNYKDYIKFKDEANNLYKNFNISEYSTKDKIVNKIKKLSSLAEKMWHLPRFASGTTNSFISELCIEEKIEDTEKFLNIATLPTHLTYILRKDKYLINWEDIARSVCDYSLPISLEERKKKINEENKRDFNEIKKIIEIEENKIKENKNKIEKYLIKNPTHKKLLDFIQAGIFIRDDRKEPMEKIMIMKTDLYRKLSKIYSCPIEYLATIADFELDKLDKPNFLMELKTRYEKWSIFIIDKNIQRIICIDYEKLLKYIHNSNYDNNELKWNSANKWIVRGKCKIIHNKNDIKEFKWWEILVSSKIRIEYTPAVKKCIWIITDEWGVTCHAAIISRELWKPCIIWTKKATQILKNWDTVEMDANKWIITIIKK